MRAIFLQVVQVLECRQSTRMTKTTYGLTLNSILAQVTDRKEIITSLYLTKSNHLILHEKSIDIHFN